ncbi:MAG: V-type ATP synthase subunit I [Bacillota bacterium]
MAVAKMKKVTIIGHNSVREQVVSALQESSAVQIIDLRASLPEEASDLVPQERLTDAELETRLSQANYCLRFLEERYGKPARGMIESFTGAKVPISLQEYKRTVEKFDLSGTYQRCAALEARTAELKNKEAKLVSQLEMLLPWVGLECAVEELPFTGARSEVYPCYCGLSEFDRLSEGAAGLPVAVQRVSDDGKNAYFLLALVKESTEAWELLRTVDLNKVSFAGLRGKAAELVEDIKAQIRAVRREMESIDEEGQRLLELRQQICTLVDHYSMAVARRQVQENFLGTQHAFMLSGWIKASQVEALAAKLACIDKAIELFADDPAPGENVPVILENNKWLEPFEIVTNIYGFPNYGEVDPTPLLAPFFTVFFGLALSDAGYGILLLLLSQYFLRYVDVGPGGRKLFKLLTYCSVSTIVFGALMGSWFGNLFDVLPLFAPMKRFKDMFFVVDPIQEPLKMLVVSLALGVVQIWFGLLVKMVIGISSGSPRDALLDQGGWLVLIPSVVAYATTQAPAAKYACLVGALWVVVASSRAQKNILLKPFTGLYGLYGGIGYLSDTLSYTRLLALGLATAVIGNVINQIALLGKGIPLVGWLFVAIVLVGGHTFNLLINVLGSFIHSGRLQFVEFFTKFFEGGGKAFRPFRRETKYISINHG